eukprot:m51a1_g1152 hypothetical protein (114) ;mRNA; f:301649-302073
MSGRTAQSLGPQTYWRAGPGNNDDGNPGDDNRGRESKHSSSDKTKTATKVNTLASTAKIWAPAAAGGFALVAAVGGATAFFVHRKRRLREPVMFDHLVETGEIFLPHSPESQG